MSFDFVNFDDMPVSVEAIEEFATKHNCEVNERDFWEELRQYEVPDFADSTNLYLGMLFENVKQELVNQRLDEDNISYYTNCLDSHFYINDIEIKEYEHIEKALKDSFKVEIEVLDYKILDDLENGADYDKTMGGNDYFFEKLKNKMEEEFFEVHNIRAEYQPSLDFPDEYDNDALYFIFYPEKRMSEDEVELLEEYINKEIKPMFIENINKAKQESKEISQRRLKR